MRVWIAAFLALTAARLIAAAAIPVSPDEAYYWVWSHSLAPGYYDHPPMVALWIRAGTLLLGETPLGLRLLAVLGLVAATLALVRAANLLFPARRPGLTAAALFNATLMVNAGAVLITPDTPLLVFWCLALWTVAEARARNNGWWWLATGIFAGAALLSKYTAALFGAGLVLWLVLEPSARRWLRDWRLWAGGVLAAAIFSPTVWWNAEHGWASFAKQGGRAGTREGGFTLRYLGELLGGQLGLATPLIFLLCVLGVALAVAAWLRRRDAAAGLLVTLTVPAALLFLFQATGSRVQANWPAILYPTAAVAAACLGGRWLRWQRPALALGVVMSGLVLLQAAAAPFPLPRRNDPTLARLGGWDGFATAVEFARRQYGATFVASEEYGLASELGFRLPAEAPVVAIGDRWGLFDLPAAPVAGTGLLVRSTRRGDGPPPWPGAQELPGLVARSRGGVEAELYRLYRVTAPPVGAAVMLPKPTRP
ncbi:glycosyltransferase family 39 protein [Roseomonas elaeocarpi]|uniref:Glycosyltransferase family 39 protein n=1 Tax=Roseomonas elaeocarpi TaxID=907779 RepID=A0ABV6JY13_9PROT